MDIALVDILYEHRADSVGGMVWGWCGDGGGMVWGWWGVGGVGGVGGRWKEMENMVQYIIQSKVF